ncbi:MAG TPA: STAS domain-containing protein [Verrucomicrobiae bacterium]|nr:STAS domain-containing protein [Verrucomicrobiae bacterium]
MALPSARLSVLVGKDFACVKITGRANFSFSPDFKTLIAELLQKGYGHFIIDLSECVLMDSTFLGVLAGFGIKLNQPPASLDARIELSNPNARVTELLENLGVLQLFKIINGSLQLSGEECIPTPVNPSHEEITRTSLEAHEALMAVNPDNVPRFKDVTQFLAEDLKNLQNCKQRP